MIWRPSSTRKTEPPGAQRRPCLSPRRRPDRLISRLAAALLGVVLVLTAIPGATATSAPLRSAETLRKVAGASPAQTIDRFLALTGQEEDLIRSLIRRGMAEPGPTFSADILHRVDQSVDTLLLATQALDLSQVAPALRPMTGVGMMLMLRSVLSYDLSRNRDLVVPDQAQVERQHLSHWTIPDTTITLRAITQQEAEAGLLCSQCSAGDFLFSAGTLARVPADFETLFSGNPQLRRRYGADLYVYWAMLPGGALPPKLFLHLPLSMRRLLLTPIGGQSLLQWLLMVPVSLLLLTASAWWLARVIAWRHLRTDQHGAWPHLLRAAATLPPLLLLQGWQWFAINWINLTNAREAGVLVFSDLGRGLLLALFTYLLAEAIGQMIILRRQRDHDGRLTYQRRSGAGQVLTLTRSAGLAGALVLGVRTAQDLGLTSLTLLALSSVPALAISLGTQQLIRDISDGFSLLLDGQIRTGDRCSIQVSSSTAIRGTITSLGMRSVRVQQDDGSIVTVPNSQLAASLVTHHHTNISHPLDLLVPIATAAPEQLQSLLDQVRRALAGHGSIASGQADLVKGDRGWAVQVSGWWQTGLVAEERAMARERLLLELLQLVGNESG